ncbi:MAG: metalloprotease [Sphingobacteriaceae bacterium]|nr:MAG: metalloprotease [Sphingobacteriaceae bacterium]
MKWLGRRESSNTEQGSGGGRGLAMGGGLVGIIAAAIYFFTGIDPSQLLNQGQTSTEQTTTQGSDPNNPQQQFVRVVLADTEDIWHQLFKEMGRTYEEPVLHFFEETVSTEGCGFAQSATGPFYCPADRKVYIDLTFFDELQNRFGAGGDYARAYVIAHEVGHHVQQLLGTSQKLEEARGRVSETEYNKLSVMLELQADFYAGVFAHYQQKDKNVLEPGDIEEALTAANQIGDDRLQKESSGRVEPDSFTHGTSEQRKFWFNKGYETGDVKQGDTFSDAGLR